jgi:hypothetical protein
MSALLDLHVFHRLVKLPKGYGVLLDKDFLGAVVWRFQQQL